MLLPAFVGALFAVTAAAGAGGASVQAARNASASAPSAMPPLWAVEVDRSTSFLLKKTWISTLRTAGINALVADPSRLARAQLRLARASAAREKFVFVEIVPTGRARRLASGRAVIAACRAKRRTRLKCGVMARSIGSAFATARAHRRGDLVVIRLRGAAELTRLRSAPQRGRRILALPWLTARPSFDEKAWTNAIEVARHSVPVDLGVAPVGKTRVSALRSYLRLLKPPPGGTSPPPPPQPPPPPPPLPPPPPPNGLHVVGNLLLNGGNQVVNLHGVNRSGTEYACIQGWGIFDGPSDDASISAIASWHSNIVRVPLNEDCWLGINGSPPAYSGQAYRDAVVAYVNLLHAHGLYAELSLIWAAPGSYQATYQPAAPDEDHSPALWSSLAATFRNDPNVIIAPWGETIVSANCFLNGCSNEATYGPQNQFYTTAGMQQAVTVIRQGGYNGVIAIPGIDYANDLTQWLSHEPNDPLHQLLAEAHVYGNNTCSSLACLTSQMAPVAAVVPLVFGETGETYDDSSCGSTNISRVMGWADSHGVGYAGWTWDTWGTCGSLITNFNGTPANAYGTWVRAHYLTFPPP